MKIDNFDAIAPALRAATKTIADPTVIAVVGIHPKGADVLAGGATVRLEMNLGTPSGVGLGDQLTVDMKTGDITTITKAVNDAPKAEAPKRRGGSPSAVRNQQF